MVTITPDKVKVLARMVHEANKAFCEGLGDYSQVSWNEAPGYNHASAMAGVEAILRNQNITPEEVHNVWWENKKKDGWTYGPTKDRDKKTHPSMVPYAELSVAEQYKDTLVIDVVLSYVNFIKNN